MFGAASMSDVCAVLVEGCVRSCCTGFDGRIVKEGDGPPLSQAFPIALTRGSVTSFCTGRRASVIKSCLPSASITLV